VGGELQAVADDIARSSPEIRWSVFVADDGDTLASHDPDEILSTASIGKLVLLVELARQLELGTLSPDESLSRTEDLAVTDSGLWQHLRVESLPVEDLAVLVAGVSDNLATNVLLDRVGLESVQATGSLIGLERTLLLDRVREHRGDSDPRRLSEGTARELARFMGRLGTGLLLSEHVSRRMQRWLAINVDLSMVAAAFGLDPLAHTDADRGFTVLNKTGTDAAVRADVGYVAGPSRRVSYAVIANWDEGTDHRDSALEGMWAIGRGLRDRVS
jgi:beta-lactamase class A